MKTTDKIAVENILRLMDERGLNQRKLAKLADMDPVQLNRILKSKRGLGPKSLEKIADALGTTPAELFQLPEKISEPSSRAETTVAIITKLAALDDLELDAVLSLVESLSDRTTANRAVK